MMLVLTPSVTRPIRAFERKYEADSTTIPYSGHVCEYHAARFGSLFTLSLGKTHYFRQRHLFLRRIFFVFFYENDRDMTTVLCQFFLFSVSVLSPQMPDVTPLRSKGNRPSQR